MQAAAWLSGWIQNRQQSFPTVPIVVMGDLNAYEFSGRLRGRGGDHQRQPSARQSGAAAGLADRECPAGGAGGPPAFQPGGCLAREPAL